MRHEHITGQCRYRARLSDRQARQLRRDYAAGQSSASLALVMGRHSSTPRQEEIGHHPGACDGLTEHRGPKPWRLRGLCRSPTARTRVMGRAPMASWWVAAALVLASSAPVCAHIGSRIYPVFDVSPPYAPDLEDGSVADWEDIAYDATATSIDFVTLAVGDGGSLAPDDLALRVFLGWSGSDGRIYFAVQRFDDVYVNQYDGTGGQSMWRHDNVEIMVDGDHSGGPYNGFSADSFSDEELKRLVNAQAQHYVAIVESPDGQLLWNLGAGDAWVSRPPWAQVGGFVIDEGPHYSLIEGAVTAWDDLSWEGPAFSRRSVLEAGRTIGFQISVADFDTDPGAYHGFHVLEGQESTWRMAERFVDGQLLCAFCDASQVVSAVRLDSWGRIKASVGWGRP